MMKSEKPGNRYYILSMMSIIYNPGGTLFGISFGMATVCYNRGFIHVYPSCLFINKWDITSYDDILIETYVICDLWVLFIHILSSVV
jgi:hypothetical protein